MPQELLPEVRQCHNGKVGNPKSLALSEQMLPTPCWARQLRPALFSNILSLQECQWTRPQQPLKALQSWHS